MVASFARDGEMGRPYVPSDWRFTRSGPDFFWEGERRPGLPLLQFPHGALFEEVTAYFADAWECSNLASNSVDDEVYALREWFTFLMNRGVPWDKPSDALLREWRESQREAREREEAATRKRKETGAERAGAAVRVAKPRRVERKLQVVFGFYAAVPQVWIGRDLERHPPFVGRGCAITSAMSAARNPSEAWTGAKASETEFFRRPTPSGADVRKILGHARSKGIQRQTQRPTPGAVREELLDAERNWGMLRGMEGAGLRASEVADLSCGQLWDALRAEGLPRDWPEPQEGVPPWEASASDAQKQALLSALSLLQADYRRNLFVTVWGKGRGVPKERRVPFAMDLVKDLLGVVIWGARAARISDWRSRDPSYVPPCNVFLSGNTKSAMHPGSVGNMAKAAFNAVGVQGSGHRLRAFFAQELATRLLKEQVALNGHRLDRSVRETVLQLVADALGHESPRTTLKHYVDLAALDYVAARHAADLGGVGRVIDLLRDRASSLEPDALDLVSRLIEAISGAGAQQLKIIVSMALEDPANTASQR